MINSPLLFNAYKPLKVAIQTVSSFICKSFVLLLSRSSGLKNGEVFFVSRSNAYTPCCSLPMNIILLVFSNDVMLFIVSKTNFSFVPSIILVLINVLSIAVHRTESSINIAVTLFADSSLLS